MDLSNIIYYLIVTFIVIVTSIYVWHKLLNKKPNFKDPKLYITTIILTIIALINYFEVNVYIRISLVTFVLMIFIRFLFKENLQKCIITPIFSQLLIMVSEVIFTIFITIFIGLDSNQIIDSQFGNLTANIIIVSLVIGLIHIPFIKKLYLYLIRVTDKINKSMLLIICFITMIIANLLTMILYYKVEFGYLIIFNSCLTLFCFSIVVYTFKTKNNYNKVYDKYNTTLNSLKEYEDILDRYRISNHENKNQLLTIRNMVPKAHKKTISYIDQIIENKLKDNEKIMLQTSIIPAGGLRGLIYSKILTMKEVKIDYELDFSKEVKTVNLINNISDSLMLDICQIVGVYIDNAIDEVVKLKDKYVIIEMYLEDSDLVVAISNNYEGVIEIDKLENSGYTTKTKGHGYGLKLVREIIDKNPKLRNEKRLSKEVFTQILKIKM